MRSHCGSVWLKLNFDTPGVSSQGIKEQKQNQKASDNSMYPSGDQNLKLEGKYFEWEITYPSSLKMHTNFSAV